MKIYMVRAAYNGVPDSVRLFRTRDKATECCRWYTETANAYRAACYETTNCYNGEYGYRLILETYKVQD